MIWSLWALSIWAVLAQVNFPDALNTQFPNYMTNEWYLHFNYDGNDFEGVVFSMGSKNITGVNIVLSGVTTYDCDKQITGLYYNNARGLRVWPLDTDSLAWLKTMDISYNSLNLTGGLFHSCSGTDENEVYGQIKYTLHNKNYYLIAGVNYDFANNRYLSSFSGSLRYTWNKLTGFIFDSIWGIASVTSPDKTLYWTINFVTGTTLKIQWTHYYSSQTGISVLISVNKVSDFQLTGDILTAINGSTLSTTLNPSLTNWDGSKTVSVIFSTWMETTSDSGVIILDTTSPSTITLSAPTSGSTLQWDVTLTWTGWDDTWIGIDSYQYKIYSVSGTVLTLSTSGTTTSKTAHINFDTLWTGDYQRTLLASDKLWHTTMSSTGYFSLEASPNDVNPNSFYFSKILKAKRSKTYQSNMIVIQWLDNGISVPAYLNSGVLFINGQFTWSSGLVKNADVVRIELISSSKYDHEVSAKLTIGDKFSTFRIETMRKDEDTGSVSYALSHSLRWTIRNAFQELVALYDGKSLTRKRDVFVSLKNIIQNKIRSVNFKIRLTKNDDRSLRYKRQLTILSYLYSYTIDYITDDLDLNPYLIDNELSYDGIYKAKWNHKPYKIDYDASKGYYSDDMIKRKYFPSLSAIKNYIDINNPKVVF